MPRKRRNQNSECGNRMPRTMRRNFKKLDKSLDEIGVFLEQALEPSLYDKLTLKEKVDHDLFMAYTLNTLCMMDLKLNGDDSDQKPVTDQFAKIRALAEIAKQRGVGNSIPPTIDEAVAAPLVIKPEIPPKKEKQEPPNEIENEIVIIDD